MKRLMIVQILFVVVTISTCLFAQKNKGAKNNQSNKNSNTEKMVNVHGVIQSQLYSFDSPNSKTSGSEFFIRRIRITFPGQVSENIKFFCGLVTCDFGKAGATNVKPDLADAWIQYDFSKALKINMGLMKLSFSRHMQQNAKRLHGVDFHSFFLANTGGHKHRDIGVMVRGLLLSEKIDYRFACVNGNQISGKMGGDDNFRYVGRIGYNVFSAEPEFFWAGTYLGKQKVLSFGISYDMEPGVGGKDGKSLYKGISFDAFADIPFGENGIVTTLNFYKFNEGTDRKKGKGFWFDCGYRIKKIEPLIAYEWYKPESGDKGKREAILPGINLWIKGYNANIKAEYGLSKMNNAKEWDKTFIIQSQVGF